MSGYAVSTRVVRAQVRALAVERGRGAPPERTAVGPLDSSPAPPPVEGDQGGPFEHLFEDLRTTWAQTTFYLFDPDSWR